MTDISTRADYDAVVDAVTTASESYYTTGEVVMDDATYDAMCRALAEAESAHPDWGNTQSKIASGADLAGDIAHSVPMLSLDNVFSADDLTAWMKRLDAAAGDLVVEPKFDGLAISARYSGGRLVQVLTRGDGHTGEDVTYAAPGIEFLPESIDRDGEIEFRGEVMLTAEQFDVANTQRMEHGDKPFVNPRNGAAGALRGAKDRNYVIAMTFFCYDVLGVQANTYTDLRDIAAELGVGRTVTDIGCVGTGKKILQSVTDIESARAELPFDIDGAVIKVNSLSARKKMGSGSRAPRWGIAYKYPAAEGVSVLRRVHWQVGRTGVITPRLEIDPVVVGGVTITYATGHNPGDLVRRDLRINDHVMVLRAGEVIPRVEAPLVALRDGTQTDIETPDVCPRCGGGIDRSEARWKCVRGRACGAPEALSYAVSRDCLDIEGLGPVQVSNLVSSGVVTTVADLFTLTETDLITSGGVSPANAPKIISEITRARSAPTHRVICALGIPGTGRSLSRSLAKVFPTLKDLLDASVDDLLGIDKIGSVKASQIVTDLSSLTPVITALIDQGIGMGDQDDQTPVTASDRALEGLNVVVTGTMTGTYAGLSRTEVNELIESHGGHASSSVSKKTNLVVCGESAGSKKSKAESLGIRILTESEFAEMLG